MRSQGITSQTFFEDVEPGAQIPPLTRRATIPHEVKYAGASRDFATIHYDQEVGKKSPWGTSILYGMIKSGFMTKMAGDLAGPQGVVRYLKFAYRRSDVIGDTLSITGTISKKYEAEDGHIVECDLKMVNGKGEDSTIGTARVALPSKKKTERAGWASAPSIEIRRDGTRRGEEELTDLDEIRRTAGIPWKPWVADISGTWIRMFAYAVEDMNPLYVDEEWAAKSGPYGSIIAPPTFLAALDPLYRHDEGPVAPPAPPDPKKKYKGGGNGWDEFEWFTPIRPGDVITSYCSWDTPYEKTGKSGALAFIPRVVVYENQRREIVARSRGEIIRVL